jgi:hypothetical protein
MRKVTHALVTAVFGLGLATSVQAGNVAKADKKAADACYEAGRT